MQDSPSSLQESVKTSTSHEKEPPKKPQKKAKQSSVPQNSPFGKTNALLKTTPKSIKKTRPTPSSKETNHHWSIQVGALPTESHARSLGKKLKQAFPLLLKHNPLKILNVIQKRKKKIFPIRFQGFTKAAAQNACQTLKKHKKECFVVAPSAR